VGEGHTPKPVVSERARARREGARVGRGLPPSFGRDPMRADADRGRPRGGVTPPRGGTAREGASAMRSGAARGRGGIDRVLYDERAFVCARHFRDATTNADLFSKDADRRILFQVVAVRAWPSDSGASFFAGRPQRVRGSIRYRSQLTTSHFLKHTCDMHSSKRYIITS
jgi:hypothetical protein